MKDALGVEITTVDTVTVLSYGLGARKDSCGRVFRVLGFGHSRVLLGDGALEVLKVDPKSLAVRRRDGQNGHEGNRVPVVPSDPKSVEMLKSRALVRDGMVMLPSSATPADGVEAARQLMPGAQFSHLKWGHPVYTREEKR